MRRSLILLAAIIGLAGCGSSSKGSNSSSQCKTVPAPAPKPSEEHLKAPTTTLDPSKTYTVTVVTNCGTFAFALDVKQSPKTSASIYSLVKMGFYDGLKFHRVSSGFVIQGGDPAGDGSGGPGYTVVEPPPANTQYVKGDVAMAKTEVQPPGASGSQFFVVTGDNVTKSAHLTPDYALAGKVVSGEGVVDSIGSLPTNPPDDGPPTPTVVMSKVTVATS